MRFFTAKPQPSTAAGVSFVPRVALATAFGEAPPGADMVLGHRLTLQGVARLDGNWAAQLPGQNFDSLGRDFPRPGKVLRAWAELVVDWDDYWDALSAMFTGVSRDGASVRAAATDATAAVTVSAGSSPGAPDLIIALRTRSDTLRELASWWQLALQSKPARMYVNLTGLRFTRDTQATPGGREGTSVLDFGRGAPLFADGYGFTTQIQSKRP